MDNTIVVLDRKEKDDDHDDHDVHTIVESKTSSSVFFKKRSFYYFVFLAFVFMLLIAIFTPTQKRPKKFRFEDGRSCCLGEDDASHQHLLYDKSDIFQAVSSGTIEEIKDIISKDKGCLTALRRKDLFQPLQVASLIGRVEVVNLLLDEGSPILGNIGTKSPLMLAYEKNHINVITVLVTKAESDPDVNDVFFKEYNKTVMSTVRIK